MHHTTASSPARRLAKSAFLALSAWLMIAGTAFAQPAYAPVGVQQNIPEATATGGGWTTCF
ncbi:MAG: hypothetical protein DCF27_14140, partial [Lysobacteraceae bacterium]